MKCQCHNVSCKNTPTKAYRVNNIKTMLCDHCHHSCLGRPAPWLELVIGKRGDDPGQVPTIVEAFDWGMLEDDDQTKE